MSLLIDIQQKLAAGKSAGYERWAKVFNLKQMAKTLTYLQEHDLLQYEQLEQKAAEASARFNELAAAIQAKEKSLHAIAELESKIVAYAKTADVYTAYRKSGYSRSFYKEHADEIEMHKDARTSFQQMQMDKLPRMKDLRADYAKILAEKRELYRGYTEAKKETRELLAAKANVDRVLKTTEESRPDQRTER